MTAENPISVGVFDGFSWIRLTGRATFLNSPAVKGFCESRIAAGDTLLVVDLAACTGMDSTFMGCLAGIATRISSQAGGRLQIAEPGERNRRSLEDLGLDFLMDIDPASALWREMLPEIRSGLDEPQGLACLGRIQQARHVLDAHRTLAGINEQNARGFSGVVSQLERELEAKSVKETLAEPDGKA